MTESFSCIGRTVWWKIKSFRIAKAAWKASEWITQLNHACDISNFAATSPSFVAGLASMKSMIASCLWLTLATSGTALFLGQGVRPAGRRLCGGFVHAATIYGMVPVVKSFLHGCVGLGGQGLAHKAIIFVDKHDGIYIFQRGG